MFSRLVGMLLYMLLKQQFLMLLIVLLQKNVLHVKDAKVGVFSYFSLVCSNLYGFQRVLVKIEL